MSHLKRPRLPSPAMIIAVLALVTALAGTAYAGSKIGFGELGKKAKVKTAGVGPLQYVSQQNTVVPTPGAGGGISVAAYCPADTYPIGGGIRVSDDVNMFVNDSHLIAGGWAGTVFNFSAVNRTAIVTIACAQSRDVEGGLGATS